MSRTVKCPICSNNKKIIRNTAIYFYCCNNRFLIDNYCVCKTEYQKLEAKNGKSDVKREDRGITTEGKGVGNSKEGEVKEGYVRII